MRRGPLDAFHRSNTLTFVSLASAMAAIAAASHHEAAAAGALISLAVIADTFDGAFARLFERAAHERDIGVQLDSLSDAIAFGVAPALCVTLLAQGSPAVEFASWVAAAVFAASAAARLAFYNVAHRRTDGFVGLPAPVAALLWSSALLFHPTTGASIAILLGGAAGMVLPFRVPRPRGAALGLFAVWPIGVMAVHLLR